MQNITLPKCIIMRFPAAFILLLFAAADAFVPSVRWNLSIGPSSSLRFAVTGEEDPDFNGVYVEKKGGAGAKSTSQQAVEQNLSLGAPPARPQGGHFLTKGGVQVTAHVEGVDFSADKSKRCTSAGRIEELVEKLDNQRGILLVSSYEFPGRYSRWSLGFVDPPLEVFGTGTHCTIRALNQRGRVLMSAILETMQNLKVDGVLEKVEYSSESSKGATEYLELSLTRIDVTVVPPSEVGTFDEEDRSRQVHFCNMKLNMDIESLF